MTAASEWPREIKMGLALLGFAAVFFYYAALCASLPLLVYLFG